MSAYAIHSERHMTLPTFGENRSPALTYNWAIRRGDGTLVFRLASAREAREILARLNGDAAGDAAILRIADRFARENAA